MNKIVYVLTVLFAAVMTACNHNHANSEEEHAHEENLQLTSYNNDFEVYAEAKPFVVGQESSILAHFSYLSNFKPITEVV